MSDVALWFFVILFAIPLKTVVIVAFAIIKIFFSRKTF
tara:strand:- start:20927 stop:21040 length:114 start_codon:yes stop_codon:yes gene_type:complete